MINESLRKLKWEIVITTFVIFISVAMHFRSQSYLETARLSMGGSGTFAVRSFARTIGFHYFPDLIEDSDLRSTSVSSPEGLSFFGIGYEIVGSKDSNYFIRFPWLFLIFLPVLGGGIKVIIIANRKRPPQGEWGK